MVLVIAACSDQEKNAVKLTPKEPPSGNNPVESQEHNDPFGSNTAAVGREPEVIPTAEADAIAAQMGVAPADVEPLIIKVRQFRNEIAGDLRTSKERQALDRINSLIRQISTKEQVGELTEPMIQIIRSAAADGPTQAIFRAGFLDLDAAQLGSQMMLYSSTEEIAKNRADLLAQILKQRAESSATSAADLIIYSAVTAGIQDNTDFLRTGSENANPAIQPYANDLLKLSTSPNPIYRLLAISLAQRLEPDAQKLAYFYAEFANEAEPFVRATARSMLESASAPNAAELLQRFGQ